MWFFNYDDRREGCLRGLLVWSSSQIWGTVISVEYVRIHWCKEDGMCRGRSGYSERDKYYPVGSLWSIRPSAITRWSTWSRPCGDLLKEWGVKLWGTTNSYSPYTAERTLIVFWREDHGLSMVQEIFGTDQPRQVILNSTFFWIKLYDLSIGPMREGVVTKVSKPGGTGDSGREKGWQRSYREVCSSAGSNCDVRNSLIRGLTFNMNDVPLPIQVKYERLPHFCFTSGCMGHTLRYCEKPSPKEISSHMVYSWLHLQGFQQRGRCQGLGTVQRDRNQQELRIRLSRVRFSANRKEVGDEGSKTVGALMPTSNKQVTKKICFESCRSWSQTPFRRRIKRVREQRLKPLSRTVVIKYRNNWKEEAWFYFNSQV